ncbi:MAG: META domain-containing protein [Myxococcales bacterium FL481]|nr:MAG: META domain-containing protein [Myxococcales bacterium FL481]
MYLPYSFTRYPLRFLSRGMFARASTFATRTMQYACACTLLTGAACDDEPEEDPTGSDATGEDDNNTFFGRRFLATEIEMEGDPYDVVPNTNLSLAFEAADPAFGGEGWLAADAGCNSFGASYSLDGSVLVVGDGVTTEIACEEPLAAQEGWYFAFLQASPTFALNGSSLVLTGPLGRVDYVDEEVLVPDQELVGPVWEVTSVLEGDLAWAAEWPNPATIEFLADGSAAVFGGCNEAGARYVVDGNTVSFSEVASTDLWCDDDANDLETAVFGLLEGPQPVQWTIDGVVLELNAGDPGLVLRVRDQ